MTKNEKQVNGPMRGRQHEVAGTHPAAHEGARGAALVITLILLALLSAASVAMVMLVSSDTMINGYYRNYRGSFYAADSGVNVVVQAMKNSILASANNAANPPLPLNGAPPAVAAAYAPYQARYFGIGDPGSWRSQFQMIANPDGLPAIAATSGCAPTGNPSQWLCSYPYEVTVQGQSSGSEAEQITETGLITYTRLARPEQEVSRSSPNGVPSSPALTLARER